MEAELGGPDLAEQDATDGGFNDLSFGVAEDGLAAKIGVGQPDAVVGLQAFIAIGENDLFLGSCLLYTSQRPLGQTQLLPQRTGRVREAEQ